MSAIYGTEYTGLHLVRSFINKNGMETQPSNPKNINGWRQTKLEVGKDEVLRDYRKKTEVPASSEDSLSHAIANWSRCSCLLTTP
jgi:hypothetical protein